MTKILDTKKIFNDEEILNAIKELNQKKRPVRIATIFDEINKEGKFSNLHDPYRELAEKLIIMRSHNLLHWNSVDPKELPNNEEIKIVE